MSEQRSPRRRSLLKAAVIAPAVAVAGAGAANAAGSGLESSRRISRASRAGAQDLEVTRFGPITGPGLTTRFRMEATDLGVPTRTPDGRMLFVFGDTFEQATVGGGWWRSPVALWSETTDLGSMVQWSGAVGGEFAQQLWAYDHDNPEFSTVLPSDVITIGNSIYLHVMVNKGLGNVVWTEIWRSDDNGASWVHTGAKFDPTLHGGMFQLWTWGLGDDGFVYVYSTGFQRDKPIIMHRVPAEQIADPSAYEPWGWTEAGWAWGNPPTPILDGMFGEMCLRPMEGKWALTWLNMNDGRIDCIVMDTPTSDLHQAYRVPLLWGTSWGNEDDTHVAQMYGPYIIPGSTLGELHLALSQWNTETNWPYHVMQFRIRGIGANAD